MTLHNRMAIFPSKRCFSNSPSIRLYFLIFLIRSYLHLFGWVKSTTRCSAILSANSLFIIVPILLLQNIRCITLLFAAYVKEFYFSQLNILRHHHINFFFSLSLLNLMFFYNSLNKYVV